MIPKSSKINIHFPVSGELEDYCVSLNREIQAITYNEIDFSSKSIQIPHMTLDMGFLKENQGLENILKELSEIAASSHEINFTLTPPYLQKSQRNYCFLGVHNADEIYAFKRNVHSQLKKFIKPLKWDVINEPPHITIAYIKTNFSDVTDLLNKYSPPPPMFANSIEISHVGSYGSCLGSIKSYNLMPAGNSR